MVPTSFDESNGILSRPADHQECLALSILSATLENGTPVVISCWKLTKEELFLINKTGRVYLTVLGETMPPVALDVEKWFKPLPE